VHHRNELVLVAIEDRMVGPDDLALLQRTLRREPHYRLEIHRVRPAEINREACRRPPRDQRTALVEELGEGIDAGLPKPAAHVRRAAVHAEELVLVALLI